MGRKENEWAAVIFPDDDRRFMFDPDRFLGIEGGAFEGSPVKSARRADDFIDGFLYDEFAAVFNDARPVSMAVDIRQKCIGIAAHRI